MAIWYSQVKFIIQFCESAVIGGFYRQFLLVQAFLEPVQHVLRELLTGQLADYMSFESHPEIIEVNDPFYGQLLNENPFVGGISHVSFGFQPLATRR
jgi:hypothetical protein